jgi:hypothetical protein
MAKKNSQISNDELHETTSNKQIAGEPVDTNVNPDGITIDPSTTGDSEKVTVETDKKPVTPDSKTPVVEDQTPVVDVQNPTPVVENSTPDVTETLVDGQNPVTPDTTELPVIEKPVTPVDEGTDSDKDPVNGEKPSDKEPVKVNEFKRFNIRFGYSIDSRSTTTRRTLSTTEIVKQFVKAPTCFIALETKEDLKDFETILNAKTIKVEDKDGKLVDFSDAAKKHLVARIKELSIYWIARNSK